MELNNSEHFTANIKHSETATKLRQFRKAKGYSIAAAALKSGVKAEAIFDYENDRRRIKKGDIKKLATIYGVAFENILGD